MAATVSNALSVSIPDASPLARAGIERAAHHAGLSITTDPHTATVAAYLDELQDSGAPIDIAINEQTVTLRVHGRVDAPVWAALGRFTDSLLNDTEPSSET